MTNVSGVSNTSSTSNTNSTSNSQNTASAASVDYNTFLQLLVAQLKNQDPTQPMDSTQYLSQLASFSQVEQQTNTNTKLDSLLTANALQLASSSVGRTVSSSDGSVTGTVKSVTIPSSGSPVATLSDGTQLTLDAGVTFN